jgi:hypothetical protein
MTERWDGVVPRPFVLFMIWAAVNEPKTRKEVEKRIAIYLYIRDEAAGRLSSEKDRISTETYVPGAVHVISTPPQRSLVHQSSLQDPA